MCGQLMPRSLYPGKRFSLSLSRSLVGLHSQTDRCGDLTCNRFFFCPARGVVTEPTELFRPLYFVMTSEQSLEIRVINKPYH